MGTISAEVTSPTNGRWLYENFTTKLKVGDIINYNLSIVKSLSIFLSKLSVSYTVTGKYLIVDFNTLYLTTSIIFFIPVTRLSAGLNSLLERSNRKIQTEKYLFECCCIMSREIDYGPFSIPGLQIKKIQDCMRDAGIDFSTHELPSHQTCDSRTAICYDHCADPFTIQLIRY